MEKARKEVMYKIIMTYHRIWKWYWYVYGKNGKQILSSRFYYNKAQCRNAMMGFAKQKNIPYKID